VRAVIVFNPVSGSTRGPALARHFAQALVGAGIPTTLCLAQEADSIALEPDDTHVCVGGDGTVLHALPRVLRARCALYHVPAGNENLFARHFGMSREPQQLVEAIRRRESTTIDLAQARVDRTPARLFSIMCSLGPDASVVHRLEQARTPGWGHLAYARPIIDELLAPHFPRLRVRVDGRTLIDAQRGWLVVGNLPAYALRINPALSASAHDGSLDVIFMPTTSRTGALVMAGLCLAGAQRDARGVEHARGASIEIQTLDGPAPVQLDGDAMTPPLQPGQSLTLAALPNALRVLAPRR
jgi:diacylglycerol kinase family enzyme